MQRGISETKTILDAASANGVGSKMWIGDYEHVGVSISTSGNASLTVKCQGSILDFNDSNLDFSSSAAVDNEWDYIHMWESQDATGDNGDTGIEFTGTDDVVIYKVNTDQLKWLNFEVSGYSAGNVTVKAVGFNNL